MGHREPTNVNFIASYLDYSMKVKGYATQTELRRALYNWKRHRNGEEGMKEPKSRGQYVTYFSRPPWDKPPKYAGVLWEKTSRGKWVLTLKGLSKVRDYLEKDVKNLQQFCTNSRMK